MYQQARFKQFNFKKFGYLAFTHNLHELRRIITRFFTKHSAVSPQIFRQQYLQS